MNDISIVNYMEQDGALIITECGRKFTPCPEQLYFLVTDSKLTSYAKEKEISYLKSNGVLDGVPESICDELIKRLKGIEYDDIKSIRIDNLSDVTTYELWCNENNMECGIMTWKNKESC